MSHRRHRRRHPRLGTYLVDQDARTDSPRTMPATDSTTRGGLPFAFAEEAETLAPRLPHPADLTAEDLLRREAQSAQQRGDGPRAAAAWRRLLDLSPADVPARVALAETLRDMGNPLGSLEQLDTALRLDPDARDAHVARGAALGALGRFEEALVALHQVLDLDPGNADAHQQVGEVLTRRGRWRDAVPHLRRTIELDAGRGDAYLYLGEALNHADDLHGALQAFQRAAELRPNNPRALRGLGIVLDRLRRPGEAAAMYRHARELAGA